MNDTRGLFFILLLTFIVTHTASNSHQKNYQGYTDIINQLGEWLCAITDFDNISFQPNSGAQGEYAGILAIKRYHESQNQHHRHIALIPTSAHGTNPASAVLAMRRTAGPPRPALPTV